jgi:hypothetical protein
VTAGTSIIARWFEQYVDAFHTLDPATALSYLHVPCLFLGPRGFRVMVSDAENEAFLANVMGDLKARDYSHSEITDFQVAQTSDAAALLSVRRVRYLRTGEEMERLGETYTLRRVNDSWKIVVAMVEGAVPSAERQP